MKFSHQTRLQQSVVISQLLHNFIDIFFPNHQLFYCFIITSLYQLCIPLKYQYMGCII